MSENGNAPYYITTPIYYVNDYPHIGHAYTTVACDAAARFQRLCGREVFFLTGTDEHGQKIEKTAKAGGEEPIELANRVVKRLHRLWDVLDISHDDFIRTTEERHRKGVEKLFKLVWDAGDIYEGEYEGWYAINDEAFLTDTQVKELGDAVGKDPNIVQLKEKTYFFKLSKYQQRLLDHIAKNPDFIQPESKRNEVVKFLEGGLRDLSISRTSFKWGIPLPVNDDHVLYVWFDALSNYMTAVGYGTDETKFKKWWPATFHIVGKDILRFHAVYWPAFLMSANLPLPKTIYAHGWWTVEGEKMSKSKNNFVDPFDMVETRGADAFRYFLLRELTFGLDGDFSKKAFISRVNSDLANDLGNLTSRAIAMVGKYCGGAIPAQETVGEHEQTIITLCEDALQRYEEAMHGLAFEKAIKATWEIIGQANRYIDETAPWQLAKQDDKKKELHAVLYTLMECLRIVSVMIYPFTPSLAKQLRQKLGLSPIDDKQGTNLFGNSRTWGQTAAGTKVEKGEALFQRIDEE